MAVAVYSDLSKQVQPHHKKGTHGPLALRAMCINCAGYCLLLLRVFCSNFSLGDYAWHSM